MSPSRIWKATVEEPCFVFRDRSHIHGELYINKGILPKQSCYSKCQCPSTRCHWHDQLLVTLFFLSSVHMQQNWGAERAKQLLTGAQYLRKQSKQFLTLPASECENLLVAQTLNLPYTFQKERRNDFLLKDGNLIDFTPNSNKRNTKQHIICSMWMLCWKLYFYTSSEVHESFHAQDLKAP